MTCTTTAAITAAAALLLGAAACTTQTEHPTTESLLATDLSKDEYLAAASPEIFHGTALRKTLQRNTDQQGEVEQHWQVRVDRTFKGQASGLVTVSTLAYRTPNGSLTADGGAVLPRKGRQYVFAGHHDETENTYYPFNGETGTRLSPALTAPFGPPQGARPLHPHHIRGTQTVEGYWTTTVRQAKPGPALDD
ncbi:hypothetical protein [Streptomyces sp. NBC_01465]|uniref:hypothetical protein n=1 Tax=Streptomyces sp. NBC_01465 TaxID=2903878 RepID=UPI002E31D7DE|nr:hypothetical protein [Streptomyces sp. NBC_01465]